MQVQGVEATARALAERGTRKTEQAKAAGVTAQALHTFVFSNVTKIVSKIRTNCKKIK